MRRKGFLFALAFVALVNAGVLAGVAYNRSGTPTAQLTLSERELYLVRNGYRHEDSGLVLRLRWTRSSQLGDLVLDRRKLAALGFRLPDPEDTRAWKRHFWGSSREAYVVLEFDGPAWAALLRAQRNTLSERLAKASSERERKSLQSNFERFANQTSRLVVVDAGRDPAALRARYPGRSRYLISRARISVYQTEAHGGNNGGEKPRKRVTRGRVAELLPSRVSVPRVYRAAFLMANNGGHAVPRRRSHYSVTLAYGQRYEPWIVSAAGRDDPAVK